MIVLSPISYFQSIAIFLYRFSGNRPCAKNSNSCWPLHHRLVAVLYGNKSSTSSSLSSGTSATDIFDIRLKGEYHIHRCARILRRCTSQRVCISSAISLIFYIVKFTRRRQTKFSNPVIYEYSAFFLILRLFTLWLSLIINFDYLYCNYP